MKRFTVYFYDSHFKENPFSVHVCLTEDFNSFKFTGSAVPLFFFDTLNELKKVCPPEAYENIYDMASILIYNLDSKFVG